MRHAAAPSIFCQLKGRTRDRRLPASATSARARVRELHVYGPMLPIGSRAEGWQHRGFGAELVHAAETLAEEAGYKTLEITSGIGARGYYRRLGYELCGPYMAKRLNGI